MSCPALLNGVLLNLERSLFQDIYADVYGIDADAWRRDMDDMCQAGMRKVMLFTGIPFAVKTHGRASKDMLDFIYRECALRGMEVIIATGGHPNWAAEPFIVAEEAKLVKKYVDLLYGRYGQYPSFAGWYIDYEFCLFYGDLGHSLREIYKATVEICKEKSPNLPVVASPFFNPPTEGFIMNVGRKTPQDYYDFWSDMISYSHFDILSLQDNGGQHLSFFTAKDTEPYIAAYAKACKENGCRFWGNVETGELEVASAQDFFKRFGPHGNCNTPECAKYWRSVPIERLKTKLELMSKYSECNISWGYQGFYCPRRNDKTKKAYQDYMEYMKDFRQRHLQR